MAEDKILNCKDCGEQFTFTVGEQEFYTQKGFQNEPLRCAPCRRNKKNQRNDAGNTRYPSFGSSSFGTSFEKGRY